MANTSAQVIAILKDRRDALLAELAGWTPGTSVGDKPNSSGPGTNVDHVGYRLSRWRELQEVEELVLKYEGPVEVTHYGI